MIKVTNTLNETSELLDSFTFKFEQFNLLVTRKYVWSYSKYVRLLGGKILKISPYFRSSNRQRSSFSDFSSGFLRLLAIWWPAVYFTNRYSSWYQWRTTERSLEAILLQSQGKKRCSYISSFWQLFSKSACVCSYSSMLLCDKLPEPYRRCIKFFRSLLRFIDISFIVETKRYKKDWQISSLWLIYFTEATKKKIGLLETKRKIG